ncbi:hypothetical protein AVEN_254200-1 [Araneus ventricosus]|uniref:Uncharacterized protein n=1 Tax=Araneus ventricosus TaxID=182803 RepID=A0A4Y2QU07_ARAVE|nr:hypothetical protein AVEN_254200-1 [Araneus ventricosus]
MLPIDSRQLENVKGELLKLTKKEKKTQRGQDRKAEETEEKINSRLSDMAQRGQKRRSEETEEKEIADSQTWPNVAMREEPKKQKDKEIADCQPWYNMQGNSV